MKSLCAFCLLLLVCNIRCYAVDKVRLVDLGLPSGTLWAECNVGAKNAWETGNYYAWGELAPKTEYTWETYKYCNGMWNGMTKYGTSDKYCAKGYSDNLIQLEPADDVASTTYGGDYTMPTAKDWRELFGNCPWQWTDNYNGTGVAGCIIFRAKNDKDKDVFNGPNVAFLGTSIKFILRPYQSAAGITTLYTTDDVHIFLPVGGIFDDTAIRGKETHGMYWSKTVLDFLPNNGYGLLFYEKEAGIDSNGRESGQLVRAVKKTTKANKVK